jgi:ABC-2 type transport system ATP-binding protein
MTAAIVELDRVTKRFAGHVAVDRLSLSVPPGVIYGLLGPNGAGKSTSIRMLMHIYVPDEGTVRLFGGTEGGREQSARIGYLPEERGLYPKMRVLDVLVFLARIKGVDGGLARTRAREWLERLGLGEWQSRKVSDLSKGMQQKVQFITAIIHQPPLIILDEPFSGLDPVNAAAVKDIMLEMRDRGSTIVLSTHRMEQVEKLCDSICLIDHGHNVLEGELRAIKQSYGKNTVHFEFSGPDGFLSHPSIDTINRFSSGVEAKLHPGADPQLILKAAVESGAQITRFELLEPSLNDIFIEKTAHA